MRFFLMHNAEFIMQKELVLNILCNIFQSALQNGAELVQCLGFHIIVCPKPADGLAVDAAFFPELIGGDTLFRHGFPQPIEFNHIITSILDTAYYGGYNLDY